MRPRKSIGRYVIGAVATLVLAAGLLLPAQVATARHPQTACPSQKNVQGWFNLQQVVAHGFIPEVFGSGAAMNFEREHRNAYLSLDLAAAPDSFEYTASRITEIDSSVPVTERTKCWQPSDSADVVAEFDLRLNQATSIGLNETMMFWNAPFDSNGTAIPITMFGVSRSPSTNGEYAAVVAQDLVMMPEFSGLLQIGAMPDWLDETAWHSVRITISTTSVQIEVAQGEHEYTTVLQTDLSHAPEPLGLDFSIDNEIIPGMNVPVTVDSSIDLGSLRVGSQNGHGHGHGNH